MKRSWSFPAALLGLLALAGLQLWNVVACVGSCYADIEALFGPRVAGLSLPDMRLNSWILAWVQRALTRSPTSFFDANAFHPAAGGLTGSEHMLGVSLPLLPLAPFAPGAVLLHQAATVLSFLILGWATFALARWLTRSDWAAFVAAAAATFMPWRIFELAHVQLLSAHWIPLVWLLAGRILMADSTRWTPVWLAGTLFLQLTSSYYLAYYVTASLAVLALVLALRHGFHRDRWMRLGIACAAAYLPFVLLSLPYLQREAASDLVLMGAATLETTGSDVLAALSGRSPGAAGETLRLTYQVPLYVLLLAGVGVLFGRMRPKSDAEHEPLESFTVVLWSIAITSMVFVLGNKIQIGDRIVDLPGLFASEWIPGFRHLRTPARWSILPGLAMPILAGIGVYRGERFLARLAPERGRAALLGARVGVITLLLLGMSWGSIPVRPAHLEELVRPYEALRDLPPGPVLEIPWPRTRLREADTGSRYMLASTLHWNPILNGFAPYPPRSYRFLHRLGSGSPSQSRLEELKRLSGLRWIVIHLRQVAPAEREEWERLTEEGILRRVYADPTTWIVELADRNGAGAWLDALTTPEDRGQTLSGLSREPIVVPPGAGRLEVSFPTTLPRGVPREVLAPIEARIQNTTSRAWPGFDPWTEGLVQLRYRFLASDGGVVAEGVVPLDGDVQAQGLLVMRGLLPSPEATGRHRVRFDLVQRLGGRLVELPVPAFEQWVRVGGPAARAPMRNS